MKNKPKPRRARALLVAVASAGLATLGGCPTDSNGPFGNLKAPDCDAAAEEPYCHPPDMAVPDLIDSDGPFGNLKAPDCDAGDSAPFCNKDGG
jgi:hypothetical protein